MIQTELDFSRSVTNAAIQQAVDHANEVHPDWSERAFNYLRQYIRMKKNLRREPTFMVEEVRAYSEYYHLSKPPSERAWGAVIRRAVIAGLVTRAGYEQVKNVKAHRANASVWRVL